MISDPLSNYAMDVVEETRRKRLIEAVNEVGTLAAINDKLGRVRTDSTLSQIINRSTGTKTNKPKTMGSEQARALETALNKPRGWFDWPVALTETDAAVVAEVPRITYWPFTIPAEELQRLLTEADLRSVDAYIHGLVAARRNDARKSAPAARAAVGHDL